jgi:hypothetical protein
VLIYSMVNAVLFGIGLLIVLLMPPFNAHLGLWIPSLDAEISFSSPSLFRRDRRQYAR